MKNDTLIAHEILTRALNTLVFNESQILKDLKNHSPEDIVHEIIDYVTTDLISELSKPIRKKK